MRNWTLFWLLLITYCFTKRSTVQARKSHCCLRGATICQCPPVTILPRYNGCPIRIGKEEFTKTQTKDIYLTNKTIDQGLYSVVAFDEDRIPHPAQTELAWVVFLAINVKHTCLMGPQPCTVKPIIQSNFTPCLHMFDHEIRINLFLIKQARFLNKEQFIATATVLAHYDLTPDPSLIEYARFRDDRMYDPPPVRAMQFNVVRCNRQANLVTATQRMEESRGFMEMEYYLHSPSPAYMIFENVQAMFPMVYVTVGMMNRGVKDCSLAREFNLASFEDYTDPVWEEKFCPLNETVNTVRLLLERTGRENFIAHMNRRFAFWTRRIRNEAKHFKWIEKLSVDYENQTFQSQGVQHNVTSNTQKTQNTTGRSDEKLELEEATADKPEQWNSNTDKPNFGASSDSASNIIRLHPAYAKSFIKVLFRGTWAMVRLQVLLEIWYRFTDIPVDLSEY